MGLKPPSEQWVWVPVPVDEAIEVTVVGEAETYYTHWYRCPGSKRPEALRCVLDERGCCDLCRAGYDRRVRYVLPVEFEGLTRVIEFGHVQYPTLAIAEECGGLLGAVFRVVRERPVKNAPIRLREVRREVIPEHRRQDISGFVAALGAVQLRLIGEEAIRAVEGPALKVVTGGNGRRS